jgi:hypothetical protein
MRIFFVFDAYGHLMFNIISLHYTFLFLIWNLSLLIPVIPILPATWLLCMFFFLFFMAAMFLCVFYERLAFSES